MKPKEMTVKIKLADGTERIIEKEDLKHYPKAEVLDENDDGQEEKAEEKQE